MRNVSLAEAKAHLSELLNTVALGEEIIITRHGRAVARISPPEVQKQPIAFKRLAVLRKAAPPWTGSSAALVRELRDAE